MQKKIIHGGNIYSATGQVRDVLDFSANLNPLGMPQAVKDALTACPEEAEAYPDPFCRALRRALASFHQLPADWILCGAGAADLIYRLAYALRPNCALMPSPTFAEYEQALRAAGCEEFRFVPLSEREQFAVGEEFLQAVEPGVELVCLCNPNNPTGTATLKEWVLRLAERCRETGAVLLVDECFADFLEKEENYSVCNALAKNRHVAVLRAFTKMYAMAGVRLGYLLSSNQNLLERMAETGPPWNVSTIASRCGIAALTCREHVARTRKVVAANRIILAAGLQKRGFRVYPSLANYLLFRSPVPELAEKLEQRGVLIRSCANYRNLGDGFYRAAVRPEHEIHDLFDRLDSVLQKERGV